MRTLLRYEFKNRMPMRLIWIGGAVLVNALMFLLFRGSGMYGFGYVFPIVISSVIMASLFGYAIAQLVDSILRMYKTPYSYMTFLPPKPASSILTSRILMILFDTLVPFLIGVGGVLLQVSANHNATLGMAFTMGSGGEAVYGILLGVLQYLLTLVMIFFILALVRSFMPYVRARGLLGVVFFFVLSQVAVYPALLLGIIDPSVLDFYWFSASLQLTAGFNAAAIGYLIVIAAEIAALYCVTCKLMDKKLNL